MLCGQGTCACCVVRAHVHVVWSGHMCMLCGEHMCMLCGEHMLCGQGTCCVVNM